MMIYLDTSALVKLYVIEKDSSVVQEWVDQARILFTASITYAEARAALAQSRRSGVLSPSDLRRAVAELDSAWGAYNAVEINEALVLRAGRLAEAHALRGYDAVQLAAALQARVAGGDYRFAAFDGRLNDAAVREGLRLSDLPNTVEERSVVAYRGRSRRLDRRQVAASGRSR